MGGIGSGGARDNAGRPAIDGEVRATISLTMPPSLIRGLRNNARQKGMSVSQLVVEILENRI